MEEKKFWLYLLVLVVVITLCMFYVATICGFGGFALSGMLIGFGIAGFAKILYRKKE